MPFLSAWNLCIPWWQDHLGVGAGLTGILIAAPAVGSLVSATVIASLAVVRYHGRIFCLGLALQMVAVVPVVHRDADGVRVGRSGIHRHADHHHHDLVRARDAGNGTGDAGALHRRGGPRRVGRGNCCQLHGRPGSRGDQHYVGIATLGAGDGLHTIGKTSNGLAPHKLEALQSTFRLQGSHLIGHHAP
jgi:hypothetical protein